MKSSGLQAFSSRVHDKKENDNTLFATFVDFFPTLIFLSNGIFGTHALGARLKQTAKPISFSKGAKCWSGEFSPFSLRRLSRSKNGGGGGGGEKRVRAKGGVWMTKQ